MKRNALMGATLLCLSVAGAFAQLSANQKPQLETESQAVLYRSPTAFPELPGKVALDLEQRGCRVPQQAHTRRKTNVIHGEFARSGQMDWAVLCSIDSESRILVYWNGSEKNPADLAQFEDRIYLAKDAAGGFQFLRGISPVGKQSILNHYRAYGGTKPPQIDHQGIDDAFIEKASVTWYFYGGNWMKLTGAD